MDHKVVSPARSRARAARVRITCTVFVLMSAMTATLLLSLVEPAGAVEPEGAARVSYADLDLGRAAGRVALRNRIRMAARELCAADEVMLGFKGMRLTERCIAEAIAAAAPQVEQLANRHPRTATGHATGGRKAH